MFEHGVGEQQQLAHIGFVFVFLGVSDTFADYFESQQLVVVLVLDYDWTALLVLGNTGFVGQDALSLVVFGDFDRRFEQHELTTFLLLF